jgi:hypothetical protein
MVVLPGSLPSASFDRAGRSTDGVQLMEILPPGTTLALEQ